MSLTNALYLECVECLFNILDESQCIATLFYSRLCLVMRNFRLFLGAVM